MKRSKALILCGFWHIHSVVYSDELRESRLQRLREGLSKGQDLLISEK